MKIKPSGSGGARTLFRHSLRPHTHSYAAHLAVAVAENGTDKRAERVQSQYFRKASVEALKATGKVWFFLYSVYKGLKIWIVLKPEPIYSPHRNGR